MSKIIIVNKRETNLVTRPEVAWPILEFDNAIVNLILILSHESITDCNEELCICKWRIRIWNTVSSSTISNSYFSIIKFDDIHDINFYFFLCIAYLFISKPDKNFSTFRNSRTVCHREDVIDNRISFRVDVSRVHEYDTVILRKFDVMEIVGRDFDRLRISLRIEGHVIRLQMHYTLTIVCSSFIFVLYEYHQDRPFTINRVTHIEDNLMVSCDDISVRRYNH